MSKLEGLLLVGAFTATAGALAVLGLNADVLSLPSALLTFALVLITYVYASRTAKIASESEKQAKAARQQAEASLQMAEEMREQRHGAVRPVIDIEAAGPSETANIDRGWQMLAAEKSNPDFPMSCTLRNVGLGPAFDVGALAWDLNAIPPKKQWRDFGTISIGKSDEGHLSTIQEDGRTVLAVRYRDAYGRRFESFRNVCLRDGKWQVGPLKIIPLGEW
jgi:hypothetical protein